MKPLTRMENILLGNEVKPLRRKEYFLEKAAEDGGSGTAIHLVRATGVVSAESSGEQQVTVTMNSDADEETIDGWLNAGELVFCLAPTVRYNDDQMSWNYVYHDVSMEFVRLLEGSVEMKPNSHANSLTYYPVDGLFEWIIPVEN